MTVAVRASYTRVSVVLTPYDSVAVGAGILATFSIGVAITFLLSAYYISRMDSVLQFFTDKARVLSYVSMVLIITFGLILITDNFHTVSNAIYPYLGLH